MIEFFSILKEIILPIFIIIAIGYIAQKKFQMNVPTLAKINMYFLVPAFIFVKLYSTELSFQLFGFVLLLFIIIVVVLYVISNFVGRLIGLNKGEKVTFTNSTIFFNSGNYGVPVNDLVFKGDPFAMSIQVIVLTLQNILTFSFGVFSLQAAKIGKLKAMQGYLKMPVLYAMLTGILLNYYNITIPSFIWVPANYIADALVGIALFTLGAQVAEIDFKAGLSKVYWSLSFRLLGGPAIALGLIFLMDIDGVLAQALLIASSMPTSVNSAIIAEEYNNYPGFAAQIVLFSTIFSSITVSIMIYLARILF
ncbi:AEC family transporter [Bacillus timonensis]|uniref:AEC family transporter n=1 Tax=Bacillus timonensis TaxID=1033734 RepID=A0A4S3PTN7_9BACI|nr:AEC family transporter [Bacillus timonensis]THE12834.1 AEC family transporter [Bacillus timonensis]